MQMARCAPKQKKCHSSCKQVTAVLANSVCASSSSRCRCASISVFFAESSAAFCASHFDLNSLQRDTNLRRNHSWLFFLVTRLPAITSYTPRMPSSQKHSPTRLQVHRKLFCLAHISESHSRPLVRRVSADGQKSLASSSSRSKRSSRGWPASRSRPRRRFATPATT